MVIPVLLVTFVVILCSSSVNGVYKYGFEAAVLDYPQRFKELLPDGIPQGILDFYVPRDVLSNKCLEDSKVYLQGLEQFQPWAVKMLDSSSKLPSGLMRGHLQDLGSYDECLHVDLGSPFKTQFCMIHFPGVLPLAKYSKENLTVVSGGMPLIYPELVLSLCLPATCTLEDVNNHYNNAANKLNGTAFVNQYGCSTKGRDKFDTLDWAAVAYLLIVLFVIIASTLYEIFIPYFEPVDNDSERSFISQVVISFSVISNGKRILKISDPNRSLSFINGIRFFSICWILTGHHYYMNSYFAPSLNNIDALEALTGLHTSWLMSGPLSVDTFFVLSGCLLSYFFLNMKKEGKQVRFNVFYFYLHRYIRYAPAVLTTVLLSATLFNYVGDGPLWNHFAIRHKEFCRSNWWTNIIFLNNYINIEEQCASFTWFLCVDMQLYILSPLVLLPMRKYKNFAYIVLPLLIVASMINSFLISFINELPAGSLLSRDLNVNTTVFLQYTRAHIRVGPYLVGVTLGHILHKLRNRKFYMSKFTVACGWTLALALNLSVVYSMSYFYQDEYVYEKVLASLYTAVHRTFWSIGIAWIIFACETGYGGPVRKFLSWELFQPLGKLTFCLYMVHTGFQYSMMGTLRGPTYYSFNTLSRNILGDIVAAVLLSFVASLLFEVPFRNLEDIVLKGSKKKTEEDNEDRRKRPIYDQSTAEEKGIIMS